MWTRHFRHWFAVLLLGGFGLLWAVASVWAQQPSARLYLPLVIRAEPTPTSAFSEEALAVTAYTNQYRQAAGCPPLTLSPQLTQAAQRHTDDMAYNDFFDHTGSDGSSPGDRIRDTGYDFLLAGENIAAGYPTAQEVVEGWMSSPPHRANILNCDYREIGVGYTYLANDTGTVNYRHYWAQVLATPKP